MEKTIVINVWGKRISTPRSASATVRKGCPVAELKILPISIETGTAPGSLSTATNLLGPTPKQLIERTWAGMFAFQHRELLAQGKVFQHQASASAKDAIQAPEPESKKFKHGAKVIADRKVPGLAML
jgi:hypothetical protein